ncbi:MAG: phosphate ABC transporter permease subunit PstC [Oscillospiraceae bacterium]|nr:phosphate ABC transporter permease subunit PstC [Oscillospiraceae bacterium]
MKKFKEKLSGRIFLLLALSSISALVLITVFIFVQGLPIIAKVGFFKFISGMEWAPGEGEFGIFPMIAGTVSVTLGAALIGIPVGICCSIFMAELAPEKMRKIFRPAIQLLAGIPSVLYGFCGLIFVVPLIRDYLGGPGMSILAGSIILAIMILPTIISISEVSLIALPRHYKEGALALGMTHWQTILRVQLPAAKSGIVAAVILGIGRAIGETMAVIMVLGNSVAIPESILDSVRTLTTNIGLEMAYASDEHQQALFATGIVLFVIIMILNATAQYITRKKHSKTQNKRKSNETKNQTADR